jgi:hypothetical protein
MAPAEGAAKVRLASMERCAFYLAEKLYDIVVELVTERFLINMTKREPDVSTSFVPLSGPQLAGKKAGVFRLGLFASTKYLARRSRRPTVDDLIF